MTIWELIEYYAFDLTNDNSILWYLIINIFNSYYKIFPFNAENSKVKIQQVDILELERKGVILSEIEDIYSGHGITVVPIKNNKESICFIILENFQAQTSVFILKLIIEQLFSMEKHNLLEYPNYLPFFFPFENVEIRNINRNLQERKPFFFLNGLQGTGKHTFIKNHIMYCYGDAIDMLENLRTHDFGKSRVFNNNEKKITIVDELAYCTEAEQSSLINKILEKKVDEILFICSVYDPTVLGSKGVINLDLVELCLANRVIFPSIHKRSIVFTKLISEYLRLKGLEMPVFITDDWVKKQAFNNGFKNILKFIQDINAPQKPIINFLESGGSIREVVKNTEMLAIEYAISIVGKSQNKIAKYLGISRGSLQHKLKKYEYSYHEWEE